MPRAANPDAAVGHHNIGDDVRHAAFQLCTAARQLQALRDDPLYRPKLLTGPTLADLVDARARLDAVMKEVPQC